MLRQGIKLGCKCVEFLVLGLDGALTDICTRWQGLVDPQSGGIDLHLQATEM